MYGGIHTYEIRYHPSRMAQEETVETIGIRKFISTAVAGRDAYLESLDSLDSRCLY